MRLASIWTADITPFGRCARQQHHDHHRYTAYCLSKDPTESRSDTAHLHGERLPLPPSYPNRLQLQARSDLVVRALARRAELLRRVACYGCGQRPLSSGCSAGSAERGRSDAVLIEGSPGLTILVRVSKLHWVPRSARPPEPAPSRRPGGNERPHRLLSCDGTTTEPGDCRQLRGTDSCCWQPPLLCDVTAFLARGRRLPFVCALAHAASVPLGASSSTKWPNGILAPFICAATAPVGRMSAHTQSVTALSTMALTAATESHRRLERAWVLPMLRLGNPTAQSRAQRRGRG